MSLKFAKWARAALNRPSTGPQPSYPQHQQRAGPTPTSADDISGDVLSVNYWTSVHQGWWLASQMPTMEVQDLYIYPVKSLSPISLKECEVDEYGLKYDRMYALTYPDKDGVYRIITQLQVPALARIKVELNDKHILLRYDKDGQVSELKLPTDLADLPTGMPTLKMEHWGFDMVCHDVGAVDPGIGTFLRGFLVDKPVYAQATIIASKERRPVPTSTKGTEEFVKESGREYRNSFQYRFPGTIMTTASLDDLNRHIEFRGDSPIDVRSLRMNIVINTDEPWIEDDWLRVRIGEHDWYVDELTARCPITTVDPDLGTFRRSRQPLPELNRFRLIEKGKSAVFGLNAFHKDFGYTMRVGDRVEVIEATA